MKIIVEGVSSWNGVTSTVFYKCKIWGYLLKYVIDNYMICPGQYCISRLSQVIQKRIWKLSTGNANNDGPFIETGFAPQWVMTKSYSGGTNDWTIWDNTRNETNERSQRGFPNLSASETKVSTTWISFRMDSET